MPKKRNPFRPVTPKHVIVGRYTNHAIPSYRIRVLYTRRSKYDTSGQPKKA